MPNIEKLKSQITGCWLGKNIGGTLGAPFEGTKEVLDLTFYTQKDLYGKPVPNDDLDLQIVWLTLVEYYGLYRLTSRLMGEYWMNNIIGPWNEYSICRNNCQNGFYPPLSGSCNNDLWKWSNGAWIRSELWACLFPGDPDSALQFAWLDASCDHSGEGIYAEMFTVALESAAFVEKDIRQLIRIGLSKIPESSRLYESIKLVCDCYDSGDDWKTARQKVVELNSDLGFFQAPGNVAFVVIGLLYGEGDFSKTICTAVNCGDDADCTAATAGAVMGIILGEENLPEEWIKPIGRSIITVAINPHGLLPQIPKTIDEMTARIMKQLEIIRTEYPSLNEPPEDLCSQKEAERIWNKSPYELWFNIDWGEVGVEYINGPWISSGEACQIKLHIRNMTMANSEVRYRWRLPEGWSSSAKTGAMAGSHFCDTAVDTDLIPAGVPEEPTVVVELEITSGDRRIPQIISVPMQWKNTVHYPRLKQDKDCPRLPLVCSRMEKLREK